MAKVIAILNLALCDKQVALKIEKLCEARVWAIVCRAKELKEDEYERLFLEIREVCSKFGVKLFCHNFIDVALNLEHKDVWLPLEILKKNSSNLAKFKNITASIHSVDEAKIALSLGANALCVSHIFPTDCKNTPPKGTKLITSVREVFDGEIYALGGINQLNFKNALNAGANAVCVMSSAMKCDDESDFLAKFI
ncbi:thiamine phosphate synthase [Campylobacter geochelonis]|uniref:thiamine phosphate synthase n=1 Tax=Campylobacter geochelonis TaxID=1780362 RepID=UPI000770B1B3|nr:thiamine phosphate synthase [Campylobacter geochelonis]CZE51157.1 putative thiamine-phosphate pyrophosphorylase [Campylobacter geochelonis]